MKRLILFLVAASLSFATSTQRNAVSEGSMTIDYIRSVRGFTAIIKTSNCQADSFTLKAIIWRADLPKSDPNAWRVEYKNLTRGATARLCSDAPVSWTFDVKESEKVQQFIVVENVVSSQAVIYAE